MSQTGEDPIFTTSNHFLLIKGVIFSTYTIATKYPDNIDTDDTDVHCSWIIELIKMRNFQKISLQKYYNIAYC